MLYLNLYTIKKILEQPWGIRFLFLSCVLPQRFAGRIGERGDILVEVGVIDEAPNKFYSRSPTLNGY